MLISVTPGLLPYPNPSLTLTNECSPFLNRTGRHTSCIIRPIFRQLGAVEMTVMEGERGLGFVYSFYPPRSLCFVTSATVMALIV